MPKIIKIGQFYGVIQKTSGTFYEPRCTLHVALCSRA